MINEYIFIGQTLLVSATALLALKIGKEALIAFICAQCILTNLLVVKQTTLWGLTATCADAFSIGAVIGLTLLQEYYGKALAQKTIWISFFLLMFYAVITHVHLAYLPHGNDITDAAFKTILAPMPRIVAASFIVYVAVQYLDTIIYAVLKRKFNNRFLVMRTCVSISVTQLLDTVLFSYLGLSGLISNMSEIIFISYSIKLVAIILALPFVAFSKKILPTD